MKLHQFEEARQINKRAEKLGHSPVSISGGKGCYNCRAIADVSQGAAGQKSWVASGTLLDESCTAASVSDSDRVSAAFALSFDPRTK